MGCGGGEDFPVSLDLVREGGGGKKGLTSAIASRRGIRCRSIIHFSSRVEAEKCTVPYCGKELS